MLKLLFWAAGLSVAALALYIGKVTWYERYVWPAAVEHMQALAPADRSTWPEQTTPWSHETQAVEVATPEGLRVRDIRYYTNSIGMDFIAIKAGRFQPEAGFTSQSDKWPLRRASRSQARQMPPTITLSHDYFIGAFEVTNAQFERFDPSHKARRPDYQQGRDADYHPAEPVTWQEAQKFSRWLSAKEGRSYRLPTEAEWEYAATAGTRTRVYWGEQVYDRTKANLGGLHSNKETAKEDGYRETAPVGQYPANPWGLYDAIGNAYEWVSDWWHPNLMQDATDPQGPAEGRVRMGKGGSWTTRFYAIYTGEDDGNNPADLHDARGFRLLVELDDRLSENNVGGE